MLLKNPPRREYRLKDGTSAPGVTTVIGVMGKPELNKWYWEGGYECGRDEAAITFAEWRQRNMDGTAGVGTITHYKIHNWLLGFSDEHESYDEKWSSEHIVAAKIPFRVFKDYYLDRGASPILSEYSSVHQRQRYGGTLDLLVSTRDGIELWDIKTSKAIYDEYWIQLAGYKALLDQHSNFRHMKITPRVVLVTKDGRLDAPDISAASFNKARDTWASLIKMYHNLQEFRRAA
jgi:hypothetical protein